MIYKSPGIWNQHFSLLYKDLSLEHYYTDCIDDNPLIELKNFLVSSHKAIECLVLHSENFLFPIDLPVKNIIFVSRNEDSVYFIDPKYFKPEINYFIYTVFPSVQFYSLNIKKTNIPNNLKFLPSQTSWYGHFAPNDTLHSIISMNPTLDTNKLKKLKDYNRILWTGRNTPSRNNALNLIQNSTQYQIVATKWSPTEREFEAKRDRYIDFLIEHECFCALSLDGVTAQCYRDSEICLSYIPNLKYTEISDLDCSAGGSIYSAHSVQDLSKQIINIKQDLESENYSKLIMARSFMYNSYRLRSQSLLNYGILAMMSYKNIPESLLFLDDKIIKNPNLLFNLSNFQ
jgi:hypothetical protein